MPFFKPVLSPGDQRDNTLAAGQFAEAFLSSAFIGEAGRRKLSDRQHTERLRAFIEATLIQEATQRKLLLQNVLAERQFKNIFSQFFKLVLLSPQFEGPHAANAPLPVPKAATTYLQTQLPVEYQRMQSADQRSQNQPTSLIDVLVTQGYIPSNEHGFVADINLALDDVKGQQGNAFVALNLDLNSHPSVRAASVNALAEKIKAQLRLAPSPPYTDKTLLSAVENGRHHFVVLKINISHGGQIKIELRDSKGTDNTTSEHRTKNNEILQIAIDAAKKAKLEDLSLASLVPDGAPADRAESAVTGSCTYQTGKDKQTENADCPFYVVRDILRTCESLAQRDVKLDSNDLVNRDMRVAKVAILKKIAAKKGNPLGQHIQVDPDLGIIYLNNRDEFRAAKPGLMQVRQRADDLSPQAQIIYMRVLSYIQTQKDARKTVPMIQKELGNDFQVYQHLKTSMTAGDQGDKLTYDFLAREAAERVASLTPKPTGKSEVDNPLKPDEVTGFRNLFGFKARVKLTTPGASAGKAAIAASKLPPLPVIKIEPTELTPSAVQKNAAVLKALLTHQTTVMDTAIKKNATLLRRDQVPEFDFGKAALTVYCDAEQLKVYAAALDAKLKQQNEAALPAQLKTANQVLAGAGHDIEALAVQSEMAANLARTAIGQPAPIDAQKESAAYTAIKGKNRKSKDYTAASATLTAMHERAVLVGTKSAGPARNAQEAEDEKLARILQNQEIITFFKSKQPGKASEAADAEMARKLQAQLNRQPARKRRS